MGIRGPERVSPRGDVFKLDVKKLRLPFVRLQTVQKTVFFSVCLSSLFPSAALQTQWTTAITGQFAEISRQLRHLSAKAQGKTANSNFFLPSVQTLKNPFTTFCFKAMFFLLTEEPTHLVLSRFHSKRSRLA